MTVVSVIIGSTDRLGVQLRVIKKVWATWLELMVTTRSKSKVPGGSETTG